MALITRDDFIETLGKLKQRGGKYIASKFNFRKIDRTKSTFNEIQIEGSNWWMIPAVKKRWNEKITGDPDNIYENHLMETHLKGKTNLRMLSVGCGNGGHETTFASYPQFNDITGIDISDKLIWQGNKLANERKLDNLRANLYEFDLPPNYYDVILFHSSLHHFP